MNNEHLLLALGKRVRRLRMQQNRSLKSLAEQAGLSRRFLVEIEAGRANPSLSKLASLSSACSGELRDRGCGGADVEREMKRQAETDTEAETETETETETDTDTDTERER